MKTSEILERGAEYIETWGWQQGWLGGNNGGVRPDGPACAVGALVSVAKKPGIPWDARAALLEAIPPGESLGSWNDQKGRTQEEVVGLMREVAATLRAKGE